MPVNVRDIGGTSRDKQGQGRDKQEEDRDKQGQAGTAPFCHCLSLSDPACPYLSLFVPACPCLSMLVPICPCLSLYVCTFVATFALPKHFPLQMIITVFISMNKVTLTLLEKATVPMHVNLVFNFFSLFYFWSCFLDNPCIHPNSSIVVIDFTKGSTWFLSNFVLLA